MILIAKGIYITSGAVAHLLAARPLRYFVSGSGSTRMSRSLSSESSRAATELNTRAFVA